MRRRRRLGSALAVAGPLVVAAVARAGAPNDQYGLFAMNTPTINDLRTGLTWQRSVSTQTFNFNDAAAYCAALSTAQPGLTVGWRVPSYKELLTLVDEQPHTEYESLGLVEKWIDPNAFLGTPVSESFWTSSLYLPMFGFAYAVNFHTGTAAGEDMGHALFVRCVHD
jgi:hypothetical protein